jgi:DNA-binding response OmpR family regulator
MNKRILIVDDDSSIRHSLSKLLRGEGYEIELAEDGQKAIEKFLQEPVDFLLLDLGLPVKDGWGMLNWLGSARARVPVIIITGQNNQRELAEKAGADALMEKPLDVPRLLQMVRELINEPVENRVQRLANFQYAPCDNERFRDLQNKRFATPWPPPEAKDNLNDDHAS